MHANRVLFFSIAHWFWCLFVVCVLWATNRIEWRGGGGRRIHWKKKIEWWSVMKMKRENSHTHIHMYLIGASLCRRIEKVRCRLRNLYKILLQKNYAHKNFRRLNPGTELTFAHIYIPFFPIYQRRDTEAHTWARSQNLLRSLIFLLSQSSILCTFYVIICSSIHFSRKKQRFFCRRSIVCAVILMALDCIKRRITTFLPKNA